MDPLDGVAGQPSGELEDDPGVTATGIAADPATGGYWIVKSDSTVDAFAAPWYGSLAWHVPAGQSVTGIAGV